MTNARLSKAETKRAGQGGCTHLPALHHDQLAQVSLIMAQQSVIALKTTGKPREAPVHTRNC
jgi:hypothetical protein